jgi:hypothetical protein
MPATRNELARVLAKINAKIREAERLTVTEGDDDTLQRASKMLAETRS